MAKRIFLAFMVLVAAVGNAQIILQGESYRKHSEVDAQRSAAQEPIISALTAATKIYRDLMHEDTRSYERMAASIEACFASITSCEEATLRGAIEKFRKKADRSTYPDFAVELLLHYAYQLRDTPDVSWPFYVRALEEWPVRAFDGNRRCSPWEGTVGIRHLKPFSFSVGPSGYPYGLDEKCEYLHKHGTYLLNKRA